MNVVLFKSAVVEVDSTAVEDGLAAILKVVEDGVTKAVHILEAEAQEPGKARRHIVITVKLADAVMAMLQNEENYTIETSELLTPNASR